MRGIDIALLRARARAPLNEIQVLHLSHATITTTSGRCFDGCAQLEHLYLDHNKLRQLDASSLSSLDYLWVLDVSHNQLSNLEAIGESFQALGYLNLASNDVSLAQLRMIAHVPILDLHVQENPCMSRTQPRASSFIEELVETTETPDDIPETTKCIWRLVVLLPLVWSINGHFITSADRDEARRYFRLSEESSSSRDSDSDSDQPIDRYGSRTRRWNAGLQDIPLDAPVSIFLECMRAREPTKPNVQDAFRLEHLAHYLDRRVERHNHYRNFAPKIKINLVKSSQAERLAPLWRPELLDRLDLESQLSLAIVVCATLEFPKTPLALVREALELYLTPSSAVCASVVRDIVQHWTPIQSVVMLFFWKDRALTTLASERTTSELTSCTSHQELWHSIPSVVRTLRSARFSRESPRHHSVDRWQEVVKILSRSPSFPPLFPSNINSSVMDKSMQQRYDDLVPLLQAAEMMNPTESESSDDRKTDGYPSGVWFGSQAANVNVALDNIRDLPWLKHPDQVERNYTRPWNEKTILPGLSSLGQEEKVERIGKLDAVEKKMYQPISIPAVVLDTPKQVERIHKLDAVEKKMPLSIPAVVLDTPGGKNLREETSSAFPEIGDSFELENEKRTVIDAVWLDELEPQIQLRAFAEQQQCPFFNDLRLSIREIVRVSDSCWRHRLHQKSSTKPPSQVPPMVHVDSTLDSEEVTTTAGQEKQLAIDDDDSPMSRLQQNLQLLLGIDHTSEDSAYEQCLKHRQERDESPVALTQHLSKAHDDIRALRTTKKNSSQHVPFNKSRHRGGIRRVNGFQARQREWYVHQRNVVKTSRLIYGLS